MSAKLLAKEDHRPISGIFKRKKLFLSFKYNLWGADLADMQLRSKFNKGIRFLLSVIDLFSKYEWAVPGKDKKMCNYY